MGPDRVLGRRELQRRAPTRRAANGSRPGTRPAGRNRGGVPRLRSYLAFMKAQPGVRFVTASELMRIYEDAALSREFTRDDLARAGATASAARSRFRSVTATSSPPADVFVLLNTALESFVDRQALVPCNARSTTVYGPAREFKPSEGAPSSQPIPGRRSRRRSAARARSAIAQTAARRDLDRIGKPVARRLSGDARRRVRRRGRVRRLRRPRSSGGPDGSPRTNMWPPIRPSSGVGRSSRRGFTRPEIMTLARLQAWTLEAGTFERTNDERRTSMTNDE